MNPRREKQRKPRFKESAIDDKQPRVVAQSDPNQSTPTWSFSLCDFDGPFSWESADWPQLTAHLKLLEQSRLSEIFGERRRGNHQPRQEQLSTTAQDRLKELRLDPERLVSLRLNQPRRLWAIRDGSVLALLWWDPHHLVWPRGPD